MKPATLPLFGIAFLAAVLLASSVRADTATVCKTSWADLRTTLPPKLKPIEISDPQSFLARFNAVPPVSTATADQIFALKAPRSVLLVFITNGCVTDVGDLSPKDFLAVLEGDST